MSNLEIKTQITLPQNLYLAIAQQAEVNGQSLSNEIVSLLTPLFIDGSTELDKEFQAWEAASDEDWMSMEKTLTSENS